MLIQSESSKVQRPVLDIENQLPPPSLRWADDAVTQPSSSTPETWGGWFWRHGTQIAKGGAVLFGLALIGTVGYASRWLFGREQSAAGSAGMKVSEVVESGNDNGLVESDVARACSTLKGAIGSIAASDSEASSDFTLSDGLVDFAPNQVVQIAIAKAGGFDGGTIAVEEVVTNASGAQFYSAVAANSSLAMQNRVGVGSDIHSRRMANTETVTSTFIKTFGGAYEDQAYSVKQTGDGGYIISGWTKSAGGNIGNNYAGFITKANALGNPTWTKVFGGSNFDGVFSIEPTSDDGFIAAGITRSFGSGSYDQLILKLSSSGIKEWAKTFGGSGVDSIYSAVLQTLDGGYVVAGYTDSVGAGDQDSLILKLSSTGSKVWAKTFGDSYADQWNAIQQTSDGGFISVGLTLSAGAGGDAMVLRLDSSGNKVWAKSFGGAGYDLLYSVLPTDDGGFIVVGSTTSFGAGNYDVLMAKLDSSGNKIWAKSFGGSNREDANSVRETSDGGYIVIGVTQSISASKDLLVLKINSSGNKVWAKAFGGASADEDTYNDSISRETSDGGFVIAGITKSTGESNGDAVLIKIDANGFVKNGCWGQDIAWETQDHTADLINGTLSWSVVTDTTLTLADAASLILSDWTPTATTICQQTAPVLAYPIDDRSVLINQAYSYAFPVGTFTDADGDTLTYTATLADDSALSTTGWLNFNAGTRTFSGTPTNTAVITVKVNADDGYGGTVSDTFQLVTHSQTSLFIKAFSGLSGNYPSFLKMVSDGGYVVIGRGGDSYKAMIAKFDIFGNSVWARSFAHTGACVAQATNDGGYILTGHTDSTIGTVSATHIYAIKVDSLGNNSWSKAVDGNPYGEDAGVVQQTVDGGYIITAGCCPESGSSQKEICAIKLDSSGNKSWIKTFSPVGFTDIGTFITQTADLGYFIVGFRQGTGEDVILKVDSTGSNISWAKSFGGSGTGYSLAQQTADSGFIVTSTTSTYGEGNADILITKFDSSGGKIWSKTFGGAANDYPQFVRQVADGGYLIAGLTNSVGAGNYDVLVFKINSSGIALWAKTFGGIEADYGISIQELEDGGYVIAANTNSVGATEKILLMRLDANMTVKSGCWGQDVSWVTANAPITVSDLSWTSADLTRTVIDASTIVAQDWIPTETTVCLQTAPIVNVVLTGQTSCCATSIGQSYNFAFATNTFFDQDGDTLTYNGTKSDGSALPSWLSFNSATRTFNGTPTNGGDIGNLALKVTATDPSAASVADTFTLTIATSLSATNTTAPFTYTEDTQYSFAAPIVVATPSATATVTLTLNNLTVGTLSTGTSGSVTSTYTAGTGVWQASGALANVNVLLAALNFNPAANKHDAFSIAVDINDGYSQSLTTSTISVTGTPVNDAPTVSTVLDTQASCCAAGIGEAYSFQFASGTFTDVDGDTLTYTSTKPDGSALPAWITFNPATRTFSGTPNINSLAGDLNIKVTASDGHGGSVADTFTLAVTNTLSATNVEAPFTYTEDAQYSFASPIVITTPSITATVTLTLNDITVGSLSTSTSGSVTSTYAAGTCVWQASGATVNVNALLAALKFNPALNKYDDFSIAVNINDGYSQSLTTSTISVTGTPLNDAPTVSTVLDTQTSCCAAGIGEAYSFQFASGTFTDVDGDVLTYTATKPDGSALPTWITFNPATRTFSGTPASASDISNLAIKITATDPGSLNVSSTFTLAVAQTLSATNTNTAIAYTQNTDYDLANIVVTTPSSTVTARLILNDSSAGRFLVAASGSVVSTYNAATGVWQASGAKADVNALLAGLKYRPATDYYDSFSIDVSITDGYSQSLSSTINVLGPEPAVEHAPIVNSSLSSQASCCAATIGQPYSFQFGSASFTDADGDTLTYTATKFDNSALPSWLSFNSLTRTLSGTPTDESQVGSLGVKITATDPTSRSVTDPFTIQIVSGNSSQIPIIIGAGGGAVAVIGTVIGVCICANKARQKKTKNAIELTEKAKVDDKPRALDLVTQTGANDTAASSILQIANPASGTTTSSPSSNAYYTKPPVSLPLGSVSSASTMPTAAPSISSTSESSTTLAAHLSVNLNASYVIRHSDLVYGEKLGSGAFGNVMRGTWQGNPVAIKQLQVVSPEMLQELTREAEIMSNLHHPNIVSLYGICVDPDHSCMAMEFMAGGSLDHFLQDAKHLNWEQRWQIAIDIGNGVLHLHHHEPPILHRDLKSCNVLLDEHGKAKVTDFGLSKVRSETSKMTMTSQANKIGGSLLWMAPELFDMDSKPTKAADIFAYAIVLWELAARKFPYESVSNPNAVPAMIGQGKREKIPDGTPPSYASLISRCWAQRAEDRPTIDVAVRDLESHRNEALAKDQEKIGGGIALPKAEEVNVAKSVADVDSTGTVSINNASMNSVITTASSTSVDVNRIGSAPSSMTVSFDTVLSGVPVKNPITASASSMYAALSPKPLEQQPPEPIGSKSTYWFAGSYKKFPEVLAAIETNAVTELDLRETRACDLAGNSWSAPRALNAGELTLLFQTLEKNTSIKQLNLEGVDLQNCDDALKHLVAARADLTVTTQSLCAPASAMLR